jgi:DNA invertase Pin-like site-specific DNA recombinase
VTQFDWQSEGKMKFGYARTSTLEREAGFEAQRRDLAAAGAEKTFAEQVSSVAKRAQLDRLLGELRQGDVVIVTKLDRLARSMRDLLDIVGCIETAGASLRILAMNLDTSTPTVKLMLNVLGSVAQFEREMMLERQREGIAKAKAKASTEAERQRQRPRPVRSRCWRQPASGRRRSRDGSMWAGPASIGRSARLLDPGSKGGSKGVFRSIETRSRKIS